MKHSVLLCISFFLLVLFCNAQSNYLWLRADDTNSEDVIAVSCAPINYSYANWDIIHPYASSSGCKNRAFINFHVDNLIPSSATIISAKLNLFWCYSTWVTSSYHKENGFNDLIVTQVTDPWTENTLKWNNMPNVTMNNFVYVPPMTFGTQDITNIDVTAIVQDMVINGDNGFRVSLSSETANYEKYVVIGSSEHADSLMRPLLTIEYTIPTAQVITNFSSSDTILCEKQSIDFFDLSQNNPTSWQWTFSGAFPSSSTLQNPSNIYYPNYGQFDVELIACNTAGCDTLKFPGFIKEVGQPPIPTVTISNDTLFCSSAYSYAWYSTLQPSVVLSTNSYFVPSVVGYYFVIVTDSNGCQNVSQAIFTALNDVSNASSWFAIIDNIDNWNIELMAESKSNCLIEIFDAKGSLVYRMDKQDYSKGEKIAIAKQLISSGMYLLRIQGGNSVYYKKLLRF